MRYFIITFFTCFIGFSQNPTDLLQVSKFKSSPPVVTVEHYENRAGSANPDSSTSVTGWVGGNATTWGSSTAQARTGTTSFIIEAVGGRQFRFFDFSSGANADLPDFSGGETITISGWVYAQSGGLPQIQLTSSSLSSRTSVTFTPDTWTFFEFTGVTVTTSGNFYFYDTDSTSYWDDIRIYSQ